MVRFLSEWLFSPVVDWCIPERISLWNLSQCYIQNRSNETDTLLLIVRKTKELCLDLKKRSAPPAPSQRSWSCGESMVPCKRIGLIVDNGWKWTWNTQVIHRTGRCCLHFPRKLIRFGMNDPGGNIILSGHGTDCSLLSCPLQLQFSLWAARSN